MAGGVGWMEINRPRNAVQQRVRLSSVVARCCCQSAGTQLGQAGQATPPEQQQQQLTNCQQANKNPTGRTWDTTVFRMLRPGVSPATWANVLSQAACNG